MNGVFLGFGIIFTALTALFVFLYYHNFVNSDNLNARGVTTEAEILRKYEETSTGSSSMATTDNPSDRSGPTSYMVEYEYMTETGQLITESENVGKEYQDYLEVGAHYTVVYDPQAPEISTLVGVDGYHRGVKRLTIILAVFAVLSVTSWTAYFR
ncbi:DUF3592 domain-containing protein [Hwanghaeella grinnelliae]|uniref:DUF3592 domain-containing protein n=1 Tax=Hwanghaeella grinnelliae TaxID=2500179 RepID=A0A3S2VPQ7_9PROT|nr:DUF3592 domain-containing protein [Hwanghaeella grinnelliae]RVU38748.1 DUF3592 domain-containing protein [Hwanghaeella grinnelliae]